MMGGMMPAGIGQMENVVKVANATIGDTSSVDSEFDKALAYLSSAEQKAYEREDNAIQRSVADMKAAGINPILGFTGAGAAASSAAGTALSARQDLSSTAMSAKAQLQMQKMANIVSIVSSAIGLAGGNIGKFASVGSNAYQSTAYGFRK